MANITLERWDNVAAVRIEVDPWNKRVATLDDLQREEGDFDVVITHSDGSETRLEVGGGNGGAYGAAVEVKRAAMSPHAPVPIIMDEPWGDRDEAGRELGRKIAASWRDWFDKALAEATGIPKSMFGKR